MTSQHIPPTKKPNSFHVALTQVSSICVLLGLSLVVYAYKRALEPLYASAPVLQHLGKVVWSSSILGSFAPTVPLSRATLALALLSITLPNSSYWVAVHTARLGDPQWGALATHLIVLLPVLSLGVAIVKALQEAPHSKDGTSTAPMPGITMPVCAAAINSLHELWPSVPFVSHLSYSQIFIQLGNICLTLWTIAPFLPNVYPSSSLVKAPVTPSATPDPKGKHKKGAAAKSTFSTPPPQPQSPSSSGLGRMRIVILLVLPFLSSVLRSPTLPQPLLEPYYHPSYPLRILYSAQSVYSGVVVVGESLSENPDQVGGIDYMRYLRAGHSLLGGVWIGPKVASVEPDLQLLDEAGEKLGDTIYGAFHVQEAALLVKKPGNAKPKNALMIGLGTGIAPTSFMRHGVPTTVIEIDPVVYDAAKRFFGLPPIPPERLFIEDARGWVSNRTWTPKSDIDKKGHSDDDTPLAKNISPEDQFDIVVHDCFSGGGVPGHLYTQEFWQDLKMIMSPDAVIAVNFAGILTSDSAKAIILTLRSAFPQCRAFYDDLEPHEDVATRFFNWVFFCTSSAVPLEFRTPVESDFLGSYLRRHILQNLPHREGDISAVDEDIPAEKRSRYILKDGQNPLHDWQKSDAMGHWKVMRNVLPDVFWETY